MDCPYRVSELLRGATNFVVAIGIRVPSLVKTGATSSFGAFAWRYKICCCVWYSRVILCKKLARHLVSEPLRGAVKFVVGFGIRVSSLAATGATSVSEPS